MSCARCCVNMFVWTVCVSACAAVTFIKFLLMLECNNCCQTKSPAAWNRHRKYQIEGKQIQKMLKLWKDWLRSETSDIMTFLDVPFCGFASPLSLNWRGKNGKERKERMFRMCARRRNLFPTVFAGTHNWDNRIHNSKLKCNDASRLNEQVR